MCAAKSWSPEEDALLRSLWPSQGSSCVSSFPGRTLESIRNRVKKLKVTRDGLLWTEQEDAIIREFYPSEGQECVKRLPGRTVQALFGRAQIIGVSRDAIAPFTAEESALVTELYHKDRERLYKLLPDRSKNSCYLEAKRLGILHEKGAPWTEAEDSYLREYYPSEGGTCFAGLPNRTESAIRAHVIVLGLCMTEEHRPKSVENRAPWTAEEEEILRLYYPVEGSDCWVRIGTHTAVACKHHAGELGVFYEKDNHVLPDGTYKVRQNKTAKFELVPGMALGKLKLVRPTKRHESDGILMWECECSCGRVIEARSDCLRNGSTRSCGCIRATLPRGYLAATRERMQAFLQTQEGKEYKARMLRYKQLRQGILEGTNASNLLSGTVRKDSPLGVRGVTLTKNKKFKAMLIYKGVKYSLGSYETIEEAAKARALADEQFTPEWLEILEKGRTSATERPLCHFIMEEGKLVPKVSSVKVPTENLGREGVRRAAQI